MHTSQATPCVHEAGREEQAKQYPQLTAFQQERRSGIGGSDAKHYLSCPPYGCRRLLWYEKRGIPADYPVNKQKQEDLFERGHVLEPIVRDLYIRKTGRRVNFPDIFRHPDHPELLYHPDGVTMDDGRDGPGILECKTANREISYRMKREGLPEDYIVQLQHGMMVSGLTWGSFAVLWPDGWEFLTFDLDRDDELIEAMKPRALELWGMVQGDAEPDRLVPGSRQCQRCPWRTTCQGTALLEGAEAEGDIEYDAAIAAVVAEVVELGEIVAEATSEHERRKDTLKELLGKRTVVDTAGARVYFRPVTSMRWDNAHMAKGYRDLVLFIRERQGSGLVMADDVRALLVDPEEAYKKPSVSRPLRVFAR